MQQDRNDIVWAATGRGADVRVPGSALAPPAIHRRISSTSASPRPSFLTTWRHLPRRGPSRKQALLRSRDDHRAGTPASLQDAGGVRRSRSLCGPCCDSERTSPATVAGCDPASAPGPAACLPSGRGCRPAHHHDRPWLRTDNVPEGGNLRSPSPIPPGQQERCEAFETSQLKRGQGDQGCIQMHSHPPPTPLP